MGLVVVLVVDAATREEIELRRQQIQRDAIAVAAVRPMRVEPGGGCMDDRHRCHDADLHAALLRELGHGLEAATVRSNAKCAVVRLLAAGNRRRGRRGISHNRIRRARARGALVPEGVHRERAIAGKTRELLGRHALRHRHPITDEDKNILRNSRTRGGGDGQQAKKQAEPHLFIVLSGNTKPAP